MQLLDFHHHSLQKFGVYNLNLFEQPTTELFSAGIHPKDVTGNDNKAMNWLYEVSASKKCFAIGECGLDGILYVDDVLQSEMFSRQIELANKIRKPLIIHCVRRFSQLLHYVPLSEVPMVVHGFNKKDEVAKQLLSKGFMLSFGVALLHHVSLQQTFKETPPEKIFLETDDSETDIAIVYKKAAEIRKISVDALQSQILQNFEKLKHL